MNPSRTASTAVPSSVAALAALAAALLVGCGRSSPAPSSSQLAEKRASSGHDRETGERPDRASPQEKSAPERAQQPTARQSGGHLRGMKITPTTGVVASLAASGRGAGSPGSIQGTIKARGVRSPENVLVYVEDAPGQYKPPQTPTVMDQKQTMFLPHVLPIVVGTTVTFKNGDPLLHNVCWSTNEDHSYAANNLGTWGKGESRSFTFDKPGHVLLRCNIHGEMEGHIVVLRNPFFAVIGKDGAYQIKNVPPGEYTVATWYPLPKKLKSWSAKVTVEADKAATVNFSLGRR